VTATGDRDDATPRLVTVRIVDLPVELHARAREHSEGLQREFRLLEEYVRQEGDPTVPQRLLDLMQALRGSYGSFTVQQEDALDAAIDAGRPSLTLTFQVPADVADGARALGAMLDEADEFCRAGRHLLTLATPPELVAYRRWYLQQFVDQITGAPPVAWSAWASAEA
jgi:hypothetical protein